MDVALQYDKAAVLSSLEDNQQQIRDMVKESYQDMLDGRGRDYREFFDELRAKYLNV